MTTFRATLLAGAAALAILKTPALADAPAVNITAPASGITISTPTFPVVVPIVFDVAHASSPRLDRVNNVSLTVTPPTQAATVVSVSAFSLDDCSVDARLPAISTRAWFMPSQILAAL